MTMERKRKVYGSEFKAKVALEAACGRQTINEIGKRYEVHPHQISMWKKQFLESLPGIFENTRTASRVGDEEALTKQLYEQIGRLKVELDWLKKKSAMFG